MSYIHVIYRVPIDQAQDESTICDNMITIIRWPRPSLKVDSDAKSALGIFVPIFAFLAQNRQSLFARIVQKDSLFPTEVSLWT